MQLAEIDTNNFMNQPSLDLAALTDTGYRFAVRMVKNLITELDANIKDGDQTIINAIAALNRILARETAQEVILALLGEMSSGKTSMINTALGYPLFPVAKITTSACPIEIRYDEKFKLEVFTISEGQEKVAFTFDDPNMLSLEKRQALLDYAKKCVALRILVCENFDYYFDIRKGQADLNNTMHCAQLLTALINGYVGQDYNNVSERRMALIQERAQLFQDILGFSADTAFGIRIWIDSPILRNGLVLVDLPGLGSDTETHTKITTDYVNRAHCCVLLFGIEGKAKDTREALELMQKYEIMRFPGKSSRFVLAINKCDVPYKEEGEDYYSDLIVQAANTIYDTLHSIEIREIIPISAWYAEYRYVLNGIPPENTMQGRRLLREGADHDQICRKLIENYNTSFEYTDPHSGELISYSTRKFLEETIGEYNIRIRYLNLAKTLSAVADTHQETLSGLQMETSMIAMLEVLGSDLMKDLMKRMKVALTQTRVHFLTQIDEIKDEMDASRRELGGMLKDQVIPAYERELAKADKHLKDHMDQEIAKMQSDFFGHFCIDQEDDRSKANRLIFLKLKNYFVNFSFNPYLKSGNDLLQDYLDRQRKSYADGIDKLAGCFQALPGQTDEALDLAFGEFLESDRLKNELRKDNRGAEIVEEILNIYRKCFLEAKRAITSHLFRLSQQMTDKLRSDDQVDKEINKTVSHVYSFFDTLISDYHTNCLKYLNEKKDFTFFMERPYLSVKSIRKQISIPFYPAEKRHGYVVKLDEDLIGQNPDSHNSRMEKALDTALTSFTGEASRKIGDIQSVVSDNITDLFDAGADKIRFRYMHIRDHIHILEESLDTMNTGKPITNILNQHQDWAEETLEAVRENLAQTGTLLEKVRKEVISHIFQADSNSSNTDEAAAETE